MKMESANFMKEKIDNVALDAQFLQKIAEKAPQRKMCQPRNMNQLQKFLKLRNSKYSYPKDMKESVQDWIKKKGGNIEPLVEQVKSMKEESEKRVEEKRAETDCYFYLRKVSLQNQELYINKNMEFGIFSTIQCLMSSQKQKGNFVKRMIERNKGNREIELQLQIPLYQERKKFKKEEYIKITAQMVNNYRKLTGKSLVQSYERGLKEKFWEIMRSHVLSIPQNSETSMTYVMLQSLRMVQSQFNNVLPHSYESMLYYITNFYLKKVKGTYLRDDNFGPIWAIAFFNYRAGRKQQFYRCLSIDETLLSGFRQSDKGIKNRKVKTIMISHQSKDIFYEQLIYALKGVDCFSDEGLCDPNTLDIVWIFLRNIGIYGNSEKFNGLVEKLYAQYCESQINETKIKNLLYLSAYSYIVEIGKNEMMDQDDYLHFLITLNKCPELRVQKDKLEKRLTAELVTFIHELLMEKREEYFVYMLLIPEEYAAQEISSIISSSELLEKVKWEKLKDSFGDRVFTGIVQTTLKEYANRNHNYVLVAKKYYQLLQENKPALQFLLQMMIQSVLNGRIDKSQLKEGETLVKEILKKSVELQKEYRGVFRIFEQNRMLTEANTMRKGEQIRAKLSECQHILVGQQLTVSTTYALNKLMENSGFEVYIIYLRNVVKSYQLTLISEKKLKELQQLQMITFNSLSQLLKRQPYIEFGEKEYVVDLLNYLQQKIFVSE